VENGNEWKIPVSDKVAVQERRIHIKKGYYPAKLVEVKKWLDKDGKEVESLYGKKMILVWQIHDPNTKQPIKIREQKEGQPTVERDVEIGSFEYYMYKNKEDGSYRTAFTKNSKITRTFEALGWKFNPAEPIDVMQFVGKFAEVLVDDYDAKIVENGEDVTYKASCITKVGKLEGWEEGVSAPSSNSSPEPSREPQKGEKVSDDKSHQQGEEVVVSVENPPSDVEVETVTITDTSYGDDFPMKSTEKKLRNLKKEGKANDKIKDILRKIDDARRKVQEGHLTKKGYEIMYDALLELAEGVL